MEELLRQFANDEMVITIAVLVGLDIVLGIAAALKDPLQSFRLAYIMDFLRNDVLMKLVPYYAVWAAVQLGGDFELAGIDVIADGLGAGICVALGASILNSLRDMGLGTSVLPDVIAGSDPNTPAGPEPIEPSDG
jgi:urea transporter